MNLQKGGLTQKCNYEYSSESESNSHDEKLHRYIKEISELAKCKRTIGYQGKSNDKTSKGWAEALKNAHAHRGATKEVISKYRLTGKLAAALRDYAQNHLGNPLGKNPGDIVKHDIAIRRFGNTSYCDPLHTKAYHHKGKNPGDFWEINTKPHPFAHFAVYPEEICIKPILSSSRVGDTVLDPFMGSGTTGVVAKKLARNFIGIDINKEYVEIAEKRIAEAGGVAT
jgi:tRNA/tmRNA/rRNA uracil-C5-methylase (TrmA/RlmC/RlmD family)